MRWTDIPQFIDYTTCYRVNFGITSLIRQLNDWESDPYFRLNLCPDFQRGRIWSEDQQSKYVEYLFSGGQTGRDIYFNDPRWKSMKERSGYNEFVCVDGLQRITALSRFLSGEIPIFGHYYGDFDRPLFMTEQMLTLYVNHLQTKEEVLKWYIQMNSGGTPHSKEEIDKVKRLLEDCST